MNRVVFSFPGNEGLSDKIISDLKFEKGEFTLRNFPDGEFYVRALTNVKHKHAIIVFSLHHPGANILALLFFCKLLKDLDVASVCLVSPYLSYMRQDKQFNAGEAVTSLYFSQLLSPCIDQLVTVDPHLHRIQSLSYLYPVSTNVVHSGKLISEWVSKNVKQPVFIGPDIESRQWVSEIASITNAPYLILHKDRAGDREVKVSIPEIKNYKNHTPVIIDDIISTARTMIATINHLKDQSTIIPVCVGVHAVFADRAYAELKATGVEEVVTCNTIPHETNRIDVSGIIIKALRGFDTNHKNG